MLLAGCGVEHIPWECVSISRGGSTWSFSLSGPISGTTDMAEGDVAKEEYLHLSGGQLVGAPWFAWTADLEITCNSGEVSAYTSGDQRSSEWLSQDGNVGWDLSVDGAADSSGGGGTWSLDIGCYSGGTDWTCEDLAAGLNWDGGADDITVTETWGLN